MLQKASVHLGNMAETFAGLELLHQAVEDCLRAHQLGSVPLHIGQLLVSAVEAFLAVCPASTGWNCYA